MRLWRVVHQGRPDPWRPRRCAHRWNTERVQVTYAARCPALAVAEALAYVRHVDELGGYLLHEAEYEGSTETSERVPEGPQWPHDPVVQAKGDAWVEAGRAGALLVPTILLPTGTNVMLSQDHPDFDRLRPVRTHVLDAYVR